MLAPAQAWPSHHEGKQQRIPDFEDFDNTAANCEAYVRHGFLRKVFGLVAVQLLATVAVCGLFMFSDPVRSFVLHTPALQLVSFAATFGFLIACHIYKDSHPTNLYCLAGFTLGIASTIGTVCALYYANGMGFIVFQALALTASVTAGLTVYALRSKQDFSYMGAGLGASLWVLILGGLVAGLTGSATMHFGLAVAGAVIFSLYIIFDVYMISRRLSPDDYIPAAIELYLDIANLFLHLLRILASMQQDR